MKLALLSLVIVTALFCFVGWFATCRSSPNSESNSLAWTKFKDQYKKVYSSQDEEAERFALFVARKESIDRHNANPSRSFDMALNRMADWTGEEYARLNGFKMPDFAYTRISDEELAHIIKRDGPVPDYLDRRNSGLSLSTVKNQDNCGSCWAFATTGMLEAQQIRHLSNFSSLIELSAQELLDCTGSNDGCNGGRMSSALYDLSSMNGLGIESEQDYAYVGKKEKCRSDKTKFLPLKVTGYRLLQAGDEKTLQEMLFRYGPVAIALDASHDFMNYQSGIYEDHTCSTEKANHAVLVVGYATDSEKGDYWIAKNSWGREWGEQGYFRIKRGQNMCGLANFATFALFD